jgi:hypothetical protein
MFNVNVDDKPIIDAYHALHDLKLIDRSNKRERRLIDNELTQLMAALKDKENHKNCIIAYCNGLMKL